MEDISYLSLSTGWDFLPNKNEMAKKKVKYENILHKNFE